MRISHCFFDLDGLLLDTERIYFESTSEILNRYKKEYSHELHLNVMGLKQNDYARLVIEKTKIPISIKEFTEERNKLNIKKFKSVEPLPGVMRLICHLRENDIPIAIVTNSSRETFKIKSLNNQNLIQMFNIIVCGDDSGNLSGKPSPDLYLIAWEKFNQPPTEHCLVFEDSINGVKAALNANMNVVWVSKSNCINPYEGVTEILPSLEVFDPAKFELPVFNK